MTVDDDYKRIQSILAPCVVELGSHALCHTRRKQLSFSKKDCLGSVLSSRTSEGEGQPRMPIWAGAGSILKGRVLFRGTTSCGRQLVWFWRAISSTAESQRGATPPTFRGVTRISGFCHSDHTFLKRTQNNLCRVDSRRRGRLV